MSPVHCAQIRRFSSGTVRWNDLRFQRECFDKLAQRLSIRSWEDWYSIKKSQVIRDRPNEPEKIVVGTGKDVLSPASIVSAYRGSLLAAVCAIYPEHDWRPWKFADAPKSLWGDRKLQRRYFDELAVELNLTNWEDWYSVKPSDIHDRGGLYLLKEYQNNMAVALASAYAEHPWEIWKFVHAPKNNYSLEAILEIKKERKGFDRLAKKLNITKWEDWYSVTVADVHQQGETRLLNVNYAGNLIQALSSVYPELPWKSWNFADAPKALFHTPSSQREFMDKLFLHLGYQTWKDWYNIKESDMLLLGRAGGEEILKQYGNSVAFAVMSIYPEHPWRIWRFSGITNREKYQKEFWSDISLQREFFDEVLAKNFHIKHWEDWYRANCHSLKESGAVGVLRHYNDSVEETLMKIYPEHPWKVEKFSEKEQGFWMNPENRKHFFEKLYVRLGLKNWTDWYDIPFEKIVSEGGGSIIQSAGGTHTKALMAAFPQHDWKLWKFGRVSSTFWESEENARDFVEDAARELGVKHLDDWFKVSVRQIQLLGGTLLMDRYGGLHQLLSALYPHHNWKQPNVGKQWMDSKSQRMLFDEVYKMFPKVDDIYVCYPHPELSYASSQKPMELDIYLPSLKLAFEYQGEQHYKDNKYLTMGEPADVQARDYEKKEACKRSGITLIEIPYWWDGRTESLTATVHKHRPDLISSPGKGKPIREERNSNRGRPSK